MRMGVGVSEAGMRHEGCVVLCVCLYVRRMQLPGMSCWHMAERLGQHAAERWGWKAVANND